MKKTHPEFSFLLSKPIVIRKTDINYNRYISSVKNRLEIAEFIRENNNNLRDPNFPPVKTLTERPRILDEDAHGILYAIRDEVINKLSEYYKDSGIGIKNVYYFGNFNEPDICDDICDSIMVTVTSEMLNDYPGYFKEIHRYLNIKLYKK